MPFEVVHLKELPKKKILEFVSFLENLSKRPRFDRLVPKGFLNLGQSCYMNAAFTLAASVPGLIQLIESLVDPKISCSGTGDPFLDAAIFCLKNVWSTGDVDVSRGTLSTVRKFFPQFGKKQSDAGEFLTAFLDKIEKVTKSGLKCYDTCIQGTTTSTVTCSSCKRSNPTVEIFLLYIVDLGANASKFISLTDLIQPTTEVLFDDSEYECLNASCIGQKHPASKHWCISSLSDVALFSLGRLQFGLNGKAQTSISGTFVSFPMELVIVSGGSIYDLFGIVCHRGNSAKCGHYVSYIRSPEDSSVDSSWFLMDDDKVYLKNLEFIAKLGTDKTVGETPLIVAYRRRV